MIAQEYYRRGDAAGYQAWLEAQTSEVYAVACRFRPWEIYQLQGREIYVRVVGYDPSGQLIDVRREDGAVFTVTPDQVDLCAIKISELPEARDFRYASDLAKHATPA